MNNVTYNGHLTNTNDKGLASLLYQHHRVTHHHQFREKVVKLSHPLNFYKDGLGASNTLTKEYINNFNPNIQVTITSARDSSSLFHLGDN